MSEPTLKEMIENMKNLELNEVNPYKDSLGRITSKDKATMYSLTKRAKKYIKDPDIKVPQRGPVKNGKVSAKFGMNTGSKEKQCGRLTIDGEKKNPTRSCKDYPNNYKESQLESDSDYLLTEPEIPLEGDSNKKTTNHPHKNKKASKGQIRIRIGEKKKAKKKDEKRKESDVRRKERIFPGYDSIRKLSKGIYEDIEKEIEIELDDVIRSLKVFLNSADETTKKEFYKKMESLGLVSKDRVIDYCKNNGLKTLEDFMKVQNAMVASQKGDLYKKDQ